MGLFSPSRRLPRHARAAGQDGAPGARTHAILIVEDEPLVAFDNEHALAQAGYHVVDTVDRYESALEVLGRGGVDLVIADVRLPGDYNGIDLARHACSLDIPVLFATATDPGEGREWSMGWLAKPYAARDLVRAIAVIDAMMAGTSPHLMPDQMQLFVNDAQP